MFACRCACDHTGTIHKTMFHIGLGLAGESVNADAVLVDALSCSERWEDTTCPGVSEEWILDTPLDQAFLPSTHADTREFASIFAGDPIWVQIRATLDREEPDLSATLKLDAWGAGEVVSSETDEDGGSDSGSSGSLAYTGADGIHTSLALAGAAIGTGLVVARLAGRSRRGTGRGVAQ